ncbi:helix-turn-helix transcriptional regulator [Ahrensia marina]|nr:helix-turn-helix transcriptional regulator [Ahrensia marina]
MLVGDGRAAAAQRCGISVNTARTQLSNIFEKANVKRQAQLMKVLNELRSPYYTPPPTSS